MMASKIMAADHALLPPFNKWGEPHGDLRVDRWSAGLAAVAVGPLASDEFAMPAQHRLRCHQKDAHRSVGRSRLAVASRTRSKVVNLGRPVLRRSTRSWCRSTRISRSLVAPSACGRTSRRVSTRMSDESRNSNGGWYGVPAHRANPVSAPHRPAPARSVATWSPCESHPSGACRPTRLCPGTAPPSWPGVQPWEAGHVGADPATRGRTLRVSLRNGGPTMSDV